MSLSGEFDRAHEAATRVAVRTYQPPLPPKLRLAVVSGADRGRSLDLLVGVHTVGKSADCTLILTDALVSRRHLEVTVSSDGIKLRDLGSSNGSFFQGARFESIQVGAGASVRLGETELRVMGDDGVMGLAPSTADRFGDLLGVSLIMRQVFAMLERIAASDSAILIQGETGTGKELVAEAVHLASARRAGPLVVCDLAGIPPTLIESELFGHVRGAFTNADREREGAFVQAHGGSIFLDEVGELDLEVQPRLLRALERHQVKPVGGTTYKTVNVRVIAATNRDLSTEVQAGRFRRDLFHRLAVVKVQLPPLRERPDDIPLLVEHFLRLAANAAGGTHPAPTVPPQAIAALRAHDWPGNVRELRNVLEHALSLGGGSIVDPSLLGLDPPRPSGVRAGAAAAAAAASASSVTPDGVTTKFKEAKDRLVDAWEREYLSSLIDRAGGNVSLAARRAGIARVYLHQLMKKHSLGR